jgi:hypothetical protein
MHSSAHDFYLQHGALRRLAAPDTDYVVALLAEIHSRIPEVRELLFHGQVLKQAQAPGKMNTLQTVHSVYSNHNSAQADQWIHIDAYTCTAGQLAALLHPYDFGMLYVPVAGTSATLLNEMIIRQTTGLTSVFRTKTYKDLLAMDVFVCPTSGVYMIS